MNPSVIIAYAIFAFILMALAGFIWFGWTVFHSEQIAYGATPERNVTMLMNKNELAWCYYPKADSLYCNYAEVDSDKFRLMSSFFEFLNSGIIELKENEK